MRITFPEQKDTRRVVELTLKNLGIDSSDIAKILEVPYEKLSKAGNSALSQAIQEGYKLTPTWSPVKDGVYIPDDVVEGGFPEQAKDIPMIIGSTLNELIPFFLMANMAVTQSDNKNFWSKRRTCLCLCLCLRNSDYGRLCNGLSRLRTSFRLQ